MEEFRTVPLTDLYESPLNNRRHFDEHKLAELTESIRSKGVLVPLLVREKPHKGRALEILAGSRRYRAATAAALGAVPVRVCALDDQGALEVILIDNLQREDLQPLEEAEGYRQLLAQPGYDVAAIAGKVGKSETYVYQRLKLNDLIEPAKTALADERIHVAHALMIARLQGADQKDALAHCFRQEWHDNRHVQTLVNARTLATYIETEIMLELGKAVFDPRDGDLVAAAGPCTTCPKRTGFAPALFPELAKRDLCTDGRCYRGKVTAHLATVRDKYRTKGQPLVEVSTDYGTQAKGSKAVLHAGQYDVVTGKQCASVRKALVTTGRRDLGKVLTICSDTKCKQHKGRFAHSSSSGSSSSNERFQKRMERDRRERELNTDVRSRVFVAVRAKVPDRLGRAELERVAISLIEDEYYQGDQEQALLELLGATAPGKGAGRLRVRNLTQGLPKLSDAKLAKLLALLPMLSELDEAGRGDRQESLLFAAAKQYGVDVAAIEAAVKGEAAAKAAETKAAAKAKSKKRAAKAKTVPRTGSGAKGANVRKRATARPAEASA